VGAPLNDMRVELGNDVAMRAFREGTMPFPDGTIIARLAWNQVTSDDNNAAVRGILERGLSGSGARALQHPHGPSQCGPAGVPQVVSGPERYRAMDKGQLTGASHAPSHGR